MRYLGVLFLFAPDERLTRIRLRVRSEHETEQHGESQSCDTNNRLGHRPRLERLRDGHVEELLVLATGAGSLVLSHVNDSGFWLIKEFFNMTVAQTLKTWTVAETIIGVAGLGFTMLLSLVL